jgi:hypothetical protein
MGAGKNAKSDEYLFAHRKDTKDRIPLTNTVLTPADGKYITYIRKRCHCEAVQEPRPEKSRERDR